MRNVEFVYAEEIPITPRQKIAMRNYFEALSGNVGKIGENGRKVGLGFEWLTHTALCDTDLIRIGRQLKRSLKSAGILFCPDPYNLTQRIIYIRDGDPKVTITMKEEG